MKAINDATKSEFNTNNAWGFGGGVGTSYKFSDGSEIRQGTAYYRHLPSDTYTSAYDKDGRRVFDVNGKGAKQLEKALIILNKQENESN